MENVTAVIHFKPNSSFSERQRHLQQQINAIKLDLEQKGVKPTEHQVNNISDLKASITVFFLK